MPQAWTAAALGGGLQGRKSQCLLARSTPPACSRPLRDRGRPACVRFGQDIQQEEACGAKQNGSPRKGAFCVPSVARLEGFHPCLVCPEAMALPCRGFSISEAAGGGSGAPLTCHMSCRNLIEPDQCTYNFTVARIDVCLKKRQSQRWGGLEAPATRGLHPAFLSCLSAAP